MALGIGVGLSTFPFEDGKGYFRWVQQCERGGVDSIWQTDRLVSKEPMLECFTAMAAIAGATDRIRFGMNVASIALRDPLLVAKQCASIDMLSHGRLLPAFGLGSALSQDYVATGTATKRRGKKANEALSLVHRLWHEDDVDFDGEFFQYKSASISPKPSNPHLPLWIGGSSEVAMKRTATYGTGWIGGLDSPEQAGVMVSGIKAKLKDTGRTIDDDHYGASFSFRFGSMDEDIANRTAAALEQRLKKSPDKFMVVGGAKDIIQRVEEFVANGCSKFVLIPMARGGEDVSDQTQRLINEVIPHFAGR